MKRSKKLLPKSLRTSQLAYNRYIVKRFFKYLETRGGIIEDKAVLFIYNDEKPELSYILTEPIENDRATLLRVR